MDQPMGTSNPAPITPPPAQEPAPQPPMPAPPTQKKSHAWIWILGGCLGILVLGGIVLVALGWWGAKKAKRELEKFQPNLEEMKENADKWNKESEEWEKKSKEFRENMPSPEDFSPETQNLPQ